MLQARFDKCLEGLLPDGGAVLLAVSGGIDSMVMADLATRSATRCSFEIAHCNFHLRGEESDGDEAFVRDWAESRGIPFRKIDFDTREYAGQHGISIEMAARELRYSWFASLCEKGGVKAVAVAHNANDNAETLFLNLLRGTGLKGICGMKHSSFIQGSDCAMLVRPLLETTREEIRDYALSKGLKWREDSTNVDSAYKRNLIRNEVFPLLEKINPSFLETLNEDARRFSQVQEIADDFVALHVPDVVSFKKGDSLTVVINVDKLREVSRWEYLLYRLLEPYGFNQPVIEDLIALIKDGRTFSGRTFYSKNFVATTSRDSIVVRSATSIPQSGGCDLLVVEGPGKYSLDGIGFEVEVAEVEDPRQPKGTTVAAIGFPFTVRRWQPGDWMRPLGMGGCRKKLSDMFGDLKFSPEQKEKALVIADEGSHVLALIGYRIDESVALVALRQSQGLQGPVVQIRLI